MSDCLVAIRNCLEGFVPAILATCDADGLPNVSLISQVHFVDAERVALSYQFFNKTRRNILATRAASVAVVDPVTCAQYRLDLDYEETLTHGPVFEAMKARLAGIASHSGMAGVFQLLGSDIFRVRTIETIDGPALGAPPPRQDLLALRRVADRLAGKDDLEHLLDAALEAIAGEFGIAHALILMCEPRADRLYTVASRGYAAPGIGSEVAFGDGVIGVAAREGVPIRISNMAAEYDYGNAIRQSAQRSGHAWFAGAEIPFPGLAAPQSQLALPIACRGNVLGVLFVESREAMRFSFADEDALALVGAHLGALIAAMPRDEAPAQAGLDMQEIDATRVVPVRRHVADDSVFFGHDYIIKGVAGAILWRVLSEHVESGRQEFTNRELRLYLARRLPDHAENLEARLVLLRRRLEERGDGIRIERCGRGRFRLAADCRFELEEIGGAAVQSAN
ncbi:GAF domain-containing protein [Halovulum dunhuangense]|uniref:GAF domain-containing protein n=1 Tax=Halovulum dunhuangense TaxID=1505036 RepID=A0A849L6E6_9RHOB|nr:GAF domain-containing protein [Halovulum dunhuangense]NNU81671.1 GAF domain-containing protein [Halovulum dunhuangense]